MIQRIFVTDIQDGHRLVSLPHAFGEVCRVNVKYNLIVEKCFPDFVICVTEPHLFSLRSCKGVM